MKQEERAIGKSTSGGIGLGEMATADARSGRIQVRNEGEKRLLALKDRMRDG